MDKVPPRIGVNSPAISLRNFPHAAKPSLNMAMVKVLAKPEEKTVYLFNASGLNVETGELVKVNNHANPRDFRRSSVAGFFGL